MKHHLVAPGRIRVGSILDDPVDLVANPFRTGEDDVVLPGSVAFDDSEDRLLPDQSISGGGVQTAPLLQVGTAEPPRVEAGLVPHLVELLLAVVNDAGVPDGTGLPGTVCNEDRVAGMLSDFSHDPLQAPRPGDQVIVVEKEGPHAAPASDPLTDMDESKLPCRFRHPFPNGRTHRQRQEREKRQAAQERSRSHNILPTTMSLEISAAGTPMRSGRWTLNSGEMVGAEGFEPPTSCSQSRRATRLRHAPPRPRSGEYHTVLRPQQAGFPVDRALALECFFQRKWRNWQTRQI